MVDGVVAIPITGRSSFRQPGARPGPDVDESLRPFVAGPENRLAVMAARAVMENTHPEYNPLVFYGLPGTGKTHLAGGLARALTTNSRRKAVLYTTAVDFARKLVDAIEAQSMDDFRARHRKARLLVLEDLGNLADREAAQRELLGTLDTMVAAGRWVVVTSRLAPGLMPDLIAGLRSRLAAGLTVPLVAPGVRARVTILEELLAERGFDLSAEVLRVLADGLSGTVPELQGALTELEVWEQMEGLSVDAETARRYLVQRGGARQPALKRIALLTARSFSLKVADLRSSTRRRSVVTARGVAMYLARQLTGNSLQEIGRYFGRRDHTTVLHGCRQMEKRLKTEPAMQQAVEELRARLAAGGQGGSDAVKPGKAVTALSTSRR